MRSSTAQSATLCAHVSVNCASASKWRKYLKTLKKEKTMLIALSESIIVPICAILTSSAGNAPAGSSSGADARTQKTSATRSAATRTYVLRLMASSQFQKLSK